MRYISVSIAPLFLLLLVAAALPASASDVHPDDFEGWAMKKGVELDGRWTRAAARESGAVSADGTRTMTAISRRSTVMRAGSRMKRAAWHSSPASGNSAGIDGSSFTRRASQDFLWRSTRNRNGASRGTSKLTSPAQATRASASQRRLPFGTSSKYRRTTGQGRASAWRRSPRMGTRLSTSGTRRRSSSSCMTRGSTRVRRNATRR